MLQFLRTGTLDESPDANADQSVLVTMNGRTGQLRIPAKRVTQEQQDEEDDKAREKANKDLVQSWNDRLQLITVIATFFASTEAGLLGTATPKPGEIVSRLSSIANAGLVGAVVVHVFAAMMSFLAAFILVRYKVQEADHEQQEEISESMMTQSPVAGSPNVEQPSDIKSMQDPGASPQRPFVGKPMTAPVRSTNPRLVQVGPFRKKPPIHLLRRFHIFCILLTVTGFLFALVGTLCLTWRVQPMSVSVFATACIGICFVSICQ